MKKAFLAGLLCLLLPSKAISQELPDINYLMAEVIKRAIANDIVKREKLQFTKEVIVTDLTNSEIKEQKISRAGKGLDNDALKLNPHDISTNYHEFKYAIPHILLDAEGRRYYKINFKPKKEHQDGSSHYLKAANRCSGTIYIDADNLYMIRLVGEMPETESFSAYVLGRIKWVNVEILQNRREDLGGIVVIESITTQVKYRIQTIILGARHYFEEYKYLYKDYKYYMQ